ncbi:MAG TPA: PEPxxWA-CTERM sorting domain-containing protein [Sphingomicrobium sp.]|nr:PEPxxWA-CTERM sorting domain-containing protein [Sphingomicrobium sp.]
MAVSTAPSSTGAALASRRGLTVLILIGIAAVVAIGTITRSAYPDLLGSPAGDALKEKIHQGVGGMKTLADMLLVRSPGERAAGALASLKHKGLAAPHERALSKVRNAPPVSPLAAIVGAPAAPLPPVAVAPAVGTPLYNVVTALPAVAEAPPPILFPAMPPPPSGGGLIIPPVVTQIVPTSPSSSTTPSPVPEPASWAMMLIGFAFIARIFRARSRTSFIVT